MALDVSGYTDQQVRRFHDELAARLAELTAFIRRRLDEAHLDDAGALRADTFNLGLARAMGDELTAQLGDAMRQAQADFRAAVAGLGEAVSADLESQGVSTQLSALSDTALAAQVGSGLDDLTQVAGERADDLRQIILQAVQTNVPLDEALDEFAGKIDATVAQATALVDTALMGFDRLAVGQQATEAGFDLFLYDGPLDGITRPWCAARVGKLFRADERDREDNDDGPQPPSLYGGGFNCRHRWVPMAAAEGYEFFYPQSKRAA